MKNDTIFLIICLSIITLYFIYNIIKLILTHLKNNKQNIMSQETIESFMKDISVLINYKCSVTYEKIIIPLSEKDLKNRKTITDETLNNITVEISNEILNTLSNQYLMKISSVIKPEQIESFIISMVYDTLSKLVINLNREIVAELS